MSPRVHRTCSNVVHLVWTTLWFVSWLPASLLFIAVFERFRAGWWHGRLEFPVIVAMLLFWAWAWRRGVRAADGLLSRLVVRCVQCRDRLEVRPDHDDESITYSCNRCASRLRLDWLVSFGD